MRRFGTVVVLLSCLVLAGATACSSGDTDETSQQLVNVERGDLIVDVSGSGNVEATREARLSFGSGGKVDKIHVEEGAEVNKGDVLASLDTSVLELAQTQAEVALSQAELGKTQAEVILSQAQSALNQVQLALSQAEAAPSQAEAALSQAEAALSQAELTQQAAEYELDVTQDSKQALELALLNAQINLDSAEYSLSKAEEIYTWPEVEVAEAEVDDAEAYLEYALAGLDRATTAAEIEMWSAVVARAQISLAAAEAKLDAIRGGYDTEEVAIKRLQVDAAEKAVTQAQKNIDDLAEQVNLKEMQVEVAKESVELARQSIELARQSIELARQSIEPAQQSIEPAEKSVEQARQSAELTQQSIELARQSLDKARKNLEKATIIAPFDGVVASVFADEGDTISTVNQIIHLIDLSSMVLNVQLDEIDIPDVKLNQEAIISLDALPDTTLKGTVSSIYPVPVEVSGIVLYDVKIDFDVPADLNIKVGMSASADIVITKRSNILLVPSRAVDENSQGQTVVRVMINEQVQERPVVTGISDGLQTEIISGLGEGETVVIEVRVKPKSSMPGFF